MVAMAGKKIRMSSTALMMVHAPWAQISGNAAELRQNAGVLDTVAKSMKAAVAKQ
jgi:ATP-dependent protease ClpP protease subunit